MVFTSWFKRRKIETEKNVFDESLHDIAIQATASSRNQDEAGLRVLLDQIMVLREEHTRWLQETSQPVVPGWGEELMKNILVSLEPPPEGAS